LIKKVFPVLALAMFSSSLGMGVVSPLLPLYAQNFGAAGVWIGAIIAAYGTTSILSTPLFGRLSDRKGRKLFLCIGLLCYAVLSLGYVFANSVYALILVRLFQGAAGGMVIPIAFAYVGDLSPRGEEGKWMGYANAAFFTGFGIGPLLGGLLTDHFGMVTAFSFMGAMNFIAFLVALIFIPAVQRKQMLKEPVKTISFREIARSGMVRGLFSFQLSQALCRGAFITFLPIFATIQADLNPTLIGVLLSVNMLLISVFGPIGGNIADRFSRRGLVLIGSILLLLPVGLVPLAGDFWQLFTLSALSAIGGGLAMAGASALSVNEGRRFGMGSAMGTINMGMNIGFAAGPIIAGGLVDFIDIGSAFYFGSIMVILGTVAFVWLSKR
jgi:MFS transporter, DHA1 family, multidrug resistance protein